MNVTGLDGRTYHWNLSGRQPLLSDDRPRSALHLRARNLLAELFPADPRLEEVPLPGCRLYADFFLPRRRLLIECQGRQHQTYVAYIHKDAAGFLNSLRRDADKARFCGINDIRIVQLPHDGTDDEWAELILAAQDGG